MANYNTINTVVFPVAGIGSRFLPTTKSVPKELLPILNYPNHKLPKFRVIKERNATIAQTPAQENKRPDCLTVWKNIFLAGDWTNTGLPSTIHQTGQLRAVPWPIQDGC